jgi:hypothetical protein
MQSMAAAKISENTLFMESPVLYVESCLFYFTRYTEKKQVSPPAKRPPMAQAMRHFLKMFEIMQKLLDFFTCSYIIMGLANSQAILAHTNVWAISPKGGARNG